MAVEPLSIDQIRAEREERIEEWRTLHIACCAHLRHCTDCTADVLCAFGQALWEMADEAERVLGYSGLRRITPATLPEPEAREGDYTPAWLSLLTLTVVVLFSFAVGVLIGTGGAL